MIKANEIRIGNWLMDYYGKYKQVAYVGETVGLTNECGGTDKYQKSPMFSYDLEKNLHGIPLTPDILEKCGFKKNGFKEYEILLSPFAGLIRKLYFSESYLYLSEGREEINPIEYAKITILKKDLTGQFYLHQLQNLYFALTGQEININL